MRMLSGHTLLALEQRQCHDSNKVNALLLSLITPTLSLQPYDTIVPFLFLGKCAGDSVLEEVEVRKGTRRCHTFYSLWSTLEPNVCGTARCARTVVAICPWARRVVGLGVGVACLHALSVWHGLTLWH